MKKKKYGWGEGGIDHLLNGRFRVRWRQDGKRRSRNFTSRDLAETFRRGIIGDLARGRAGLAPDPKSFPLLGELVLPWIEEHRKTNPRNCESTRWKHLAWFWKDKRARDICVATVRQYVREMLGKGTDPGYLNVIMKTFSCFCSDLAERPLATGIEQNPLLGLPRSLQALFRSGHDPKLTPYIERLEDVPRLYRAFLAVDPDDALAFAIGVVAGLRPGEIAALEWSSIREAESRIAVELQVQDGKTCLPKDGSRIVQGPFLAPLLPLLRRARLEAGNPGRGPVLAHPHGDHVNPDRFTRSLKALAASVGLPEVSTWKRPWYQATRHTMATHWMRAGHSLGELALALGHSTVSITQTYAHMRPTNVRDGDPWEMVLSGTETGPTPGQCHERVQS